MKLKSKPEIGISILSVLLAFLVWFAVMSLGDPAISKKINGIKVVMINGSAIEDLNKIYSVKNESDMISVNVRDKRSIVDRLTVEDFVARADLSKWNELGNVPIVVSCKNSRLDNRNYVQSSYSLQLEVEDLKVQTYPIEIKTIGEPALGYTLENKAVFPENVSIQGGESIIGAIDRVVAEVDLTGFSQSMEMEVPLTVYDTEGREISYDRIKFVSLPKENYVVKVAVGILKTNKIPIEVEVAGNLPDGYALESVECKPAQVEVKGNTDKISKVNVIKIQDAGFHLTGMTNSFTKEIEIKNYLPKGVVLADKKKDKISVKVNIKQLNSLDLSIPFSDIKLNHVPENLNFELMGTGIVLAKIYGPSDVLLKVNSSDLSPRLDLKNCTEVKTYQLPLELQLPESCQSGSGNVVYVRCYGMDEEEDEIIGNTPEDENERTDNGENENLQSESLNINEGTEKAKKENGNGTDDEH